MMFLQDLAVPRDYLYGTCSSLSCRHMSTGLLENLSMVSKWIEVSTSVWLLRVAWRKGESSSAWKSMVRLPLEERSTWGLVTEQWPALGTKQLQKHLDWRSGHGKWVLLSTRKGWTRQKKSRGLWKSTRTLQVFPFPEPSSFPPADLALTPVFSSCSQMLTSMSAEMSSPSPPWSLTVTWRPDCRGMTWKTEKAELPVTRHCSWMSG